MRKFLYRVYYQEDGADVTEWCRNLKAVKELGRKVKILKIEKTTEK